MIGEVTILKAAIDFRHPYPAFARQVSCTPSGMKSVITYSPLQLHAIKYIFLHKDSGILCQPFPDVVCSSFSQKMCVLLLDRQTKFQPNVAHIELELENHV